MRRTVRGWIVITLMCLLTAHRAAAQSTASLNGKVLDQSGAALPGTSVTATSARSGVERSTVTNSDGLFTLPALDPGQYDVQAELTGFAKQLRRGVSLATGTTLTVDFTLSVAALAEEVTVTGGSPLIETTQSSVKNVLQAKEVQSLPVVNRSFTGLVALVPGARPIQAANSGKATTGAFSVGGGSGRNVNTVVDGGDNKDDVVGGILQNYTIEGIEEFNLETNRFSAALGRA